MDEELRKRLRQLNRAPLQESPAPKGPFPDRARPISSSLPPVFRKPSVIRASSTPRIPHVKFEEVIHGAEVANRRGRFLLIEKEIGEFVETSGNINEQYISFFGRGIICCKERAFTRSFQSFLNSHPSRVLYLDIETTGLHSTPLFLIGLMFLDEGRLRIQQLFAREYCEEAPLLDHLSTIMRSYDCLVTFNGKSFDIRFIRDRCVSNTVDFDWDEDHLDLLHEGRRRYRDRLENCRLVTMEEGICGRTRVNDIPGSEIPEAYHEFVRTGNAYRIKDILHHNALDLITMAELVLDILHDEEKP